MGGVLRFESKLGAGSRFHFSVPLSPADAPAESPHPASHVRRLSPGTSLEILVVDDVLENREVLSSLLGDLGCHVQTAASGAEAIERLQARPPHVVFMDIRMPGMDGIQVVRRIRRQIGQHAPKFVALSASVLAHEQRACLARGFDDFVAKPFRVDSICRCLAALVGVAFESEPAPVAAAAPAVPEDFSGPAIPEPLLARIEAAAEIYNTTALKRCLGELSELQPEGRALAAALLDLMRRYDMDGIRRILALKRVPAASAPPSEPAAAAANRPPP
jgi:CheY-like chemotaxis protein